MRVEGGRGGEMDAGLGRRSDEERRERNKQMAELTTLSRLEGFTNTSTPQIFCNEYL